MYWEVGTRDVALDATSSQLLLMNLGRKSILNSLMLIGKPRSSIEGQIGQGDRKSSTGSPAAPLAHPALPAAVWCCAGSCSQTSWALLPPHPRGWCFCKDVLLAGAGSSGWELLVRHSAAHLVQHRCPSAQPILLV